MKLNKIIGLAIVCMPVLACKKLIEIKDTDFIGGDIALKTLQNNEQEIIGAYAIESTEIDILMNATFSDEVKKGEFYNAGTTHEWQYSSTDIGLRDNYTALNLHYRVIDRVNRALVALPTADSTRTTDNQAFRARLRGEALFLRAFSQFELYRFYSGYTDPAALAMPYMEAPSVPTQAIARIAVKPYFEKLKADLAEAKNLLPTTLPSGETAAARATKAAVSGLQARVSLYLKEWANAVTYSTEYISAFPLATRAQFPGIWTDASGNNAEVAFRLKRSATQSGYIRYYDASIATSRMGSLFRGTSTATNVGTVTWWPSDKLWNSYDKVNDIRFASYLKDEPLLTNSNPSRYSHLIQKYAGTGYGSSAENVADAKVFRTGEMYLIRAEAKAEGGDLAGAATDLNDLRAARITGYANATFASKDLLITAIMDERFKELPFEGHRFWDLRRRNLPVVRLASDAPSTAATTLPAGNFRFVLPIPNTEIQANPLMQQNNGYTN